MMETYTIKQLNEMTMAQVWDLYSDPGEDEVQIEDWEDSTPGDVADTWANWAAHFVGNNANEIAYDGFVGFNDRTDLDIYMRLRMVEFFGILEK